MISRVSHCLIFKKNFPQKTLASSASIMVKFVAARSVAVRNKRKHDLDLKNQELIPFPVTLDPSSAPGTPSSKEKYAVRIAIQRSLHPEHVFKEIIRLQTELLDDDEVYYYYTINVIYN